MSSKYSLYLHAGYPVLEYHDRIPSREGERGGDCNTPSLFMLAGLDWICKTCTGFVKHGFVKSLFVKGEFVKHGFVIGGFVKHGLVTPPPLPPPLPGGTCSG